MTKKDKAALRPILETLEELEREKDEVIFLVIPQVEKIYKR